jgi:hypothetical protein
MPMSFMVVVGVVTVTLLGHPPAPNAPTARAMTSSEVSSAAVASIPISVLARLVSGMVSVGLNALEFVSDRYR